MCVRVRVSRVRRAAPLASSGRADTARSAARLAELFLALWLVGILLLETNKVTHAKI